MICASRVISFIGLLALAASLPLSERGEQTAWAPDITYPNQYTVWCVGASHHIYWQTNDIPDPATNPTSDLYLVVGGGFGPKLAQNLPLNAGQVTITVPNVTPGSYAVDLHGIAGEGWSRNFQINDC